MTKKAHAMKRGIALLVGCLVGIPAVTEAAQERKSPLADAPAIRKRFDLRNKRFELGVGMAATIGQDFYNALMLNVRLGFHITDWLGVSVSAGVYNMTPNWRSSFNNRLNGALGSSCRDQINAVGNPNANPPIPPKTECTDPKSSKYTPIEQAPTQSNSAAAENRIGQVILPQLDIVPFAGKFSLFGKLFMNYDLYISGGPGFVNLVKKGTVDNSYCDLPLNDGDPNGPKKCLHDYGTPYTGMKLAYAVGVGMHAFANNFFAINLELHDLIFKNNSSGRNVVTRRGQTVTSADLQWTNNWIVGLNFMFFLPAQVKVSH
jgi:outer membrane beta-barrel protein